MAKKDHITMRVDEETHEHLKKMAFREDRPLSNMIYKILRKAVQLDKAMYKGSRT